MSRAFFDRRPFVLGYCRLAGLCDGLTGLMLMAAPDLTLGLMGIPSVTEPILIRFIGAFVAAVGMAYWQPWWTVGTDAEHADLRPLLEITALCRSMVGVFVTVAVLSRALSPAWALVAITDLGLAAVQIRWLWIWARLTGIQGTMEKGALP